MTISCETGGLSPESLSAGSRSGSYLTYHRWPLETHDLTMSARPSQGYFWIDLGLLPAAFSQVWRLLSDGWKWCNRNVEISISSCWWMSVSFFLGTHSKRYIAQSLSAPSTTFFRHHSHLFLAQVFQTQQQTKPNQPINYIHHVWNI